MAIKFQKEQQPKEEEQKKEEEDEEKDVKQKALPICDVISPNKNAGSQSIAGELSPPVTIHADVVFENSRIYVVKANHAGFLLPGRIIPSKQIEFDSSSSSSDEENISRIASSYGAITYGAIRSRIKTTKARLHNIAGELLPPGVIYAGDDTDDSPIFVGKAYHEGDVLPAKVIPSKHIAYVCYAGEEHMKHKYEFVCKDNIKWVPSSNGAVPHGAVPGGRTITGETLYIGRVPYKGSLTPGKIHPSHRTLYIPYDGKEIAFSSYEILIEN